MFSCIGSFCFVLGFAVYNLSSEKLMKVVAINGSVVLFLSSWWLLCISMKESFVLNLYNFSFIGGFILDSLGVCLMFLTCLLCLICLVSCWNNYLGSWNIWAFYLFLLQGSLIFVFGSWNVLVFYVFFELTLVRMYVLVLFFGYGVVKMSAAYQLFLYTLLGSLMMLLGLIVLMTNCGTSNFLLLELHSLSFFVENFIWVCIFFALSVKVPLFPFHSWLPQAHVQAPTEGSIMLAGVLLKLGGFGFFSLCLGITRLSSLNFARLMLALCSCGCFYTSLITLSQLDLKSVMAYASIGHMALSIAAIFSNSVIGLVGSVLLLLGHGLVSAGLFYLVGVVYMSFGTSNLKYFGGLSFIMPLFTVMFILFSFGNISVPGFFTFVSEFLIFVGVMSYSFVSSVFLSFVIFLGAGYTVWLMNSVLFGLNPLNILTSTDLSFSEFILSLTLMIRILFLGLFPYPLMSFLNISLVCLVLIGAILLWKFQSFGPATLLLLHVKLQI